MSPDHDPRAAVVLSRALAQAFGPCAYCGGDLDFGHIVDTTPGAPGPSRYAHVPCAASALADGRALRVRPIPKGAIELELAPGKLHELPPGSIELGPAPRPLEAEPPDPAEEVQRTGAPSMIRAGDRELRYDAPEYLAAARALGWAALGLAIAALAVAASVVAATIKLGGGWR